MNEWIICKHCSLKYRAHEPFCPRCEKPPSEDQVRWSEERGRGAVMAPRSKTPLVVPLVVLALGGAGAAFYFAPAGLFNPSLAQKIERACEAKEARDCGCVGKKTVGMMTAEQRAAVFDAETPDSRELMNTASQLCLKERLVARCKSAKQGSEPECVCIVDASVNAFTSDELDQLFSGDNAPARYAAIRNGCYR